MKTYLVYSEWDGGLGYDRAAFSTLVAAREYAAFAVGPDASADVAYIEYVEAGIREHDFDGDQNDDRTDLFDVDIGANTVARYKR